MSAFRDFPWSPDPERCCELCGAVGVPLWRFVLERRGRVALPGTWGRRSGVRLTRAILVCDRHRPPGPPPPAARPRPDLLNPTR